MNIEVEIPPLGQKPSYRFFALLSGLSLLAAAACVLVFIGSTRLDKLIAIAVVGGVILLWKSIVVRGLEFLPDRVRTWDYHFWFFGGERDYFPMDIKAAVLTQDGSKFSGTLRLKDGNAVKLHFFFASVKDAQSILDRIVKRYEIEAALELTDPKLLDEASALSNAER